MANKGIDPSIYDGLDEFATVRQLEYLTALRQTKSYYGTAKACNVHPNVVKNSLDMLKRNAAKKRIAPHRKMDNAVPDGFKIKGTSTLTDDAGNVKLQWVKTDEDRERQEQLLRAYADSLADSVKGLARPVPAPAHSTDDLLSVYPWGDPHFGMYAWWEDAGSDFDLDIAERLTCSAVDRLVAAAPKGSTGLLLNLGDMFHADNQSNQTRSGNQLDVDGRWGKVQRVGLQAKIHCIKRMLEVHQHVIVRLNRGNHDDHTSQGLALMLSCFFHNEPRVTVDLSPAICWYYPFGKVLIGSTHGDTIKGKDMMAIMAADKPQEWGAAVHRYWFVGHVHHHDSKEYPGGIVEYFRTLAARDAWHQGQGYRAGRDMRLIVMQREHGEVERHRVDVGMIE